ncbi:DUF1643 domain-containing protein [Bacillus sp. T33-2]|uniref:DUF1643 domain-containing protein n=1 Tax=Bacillus sp. T33-2 TaxID=2054168 RepID=UPI0015E0D345|nr:DUF1643 domain-containing protein [Bacillus sp. T33-2]
MPYPTVHDQFEVEGEFYQAVRNETVYPCRRLAVIKTRNYPLKEQYDALLVMANPGSCQPLNPSYQNPTIENVDTVAPLIKAKTDQTQHQIIKLMNQENWNQVAICNLSDLREGNMKNFRDLLRSCEAAFPQHSIFSNDRKQELKSLVKQNKGPVILAWGTDTCVSRLAKTALEFFHGNKINPLGWKHNKGPFYYHASPRLHSMKTEWLKKMGEQVKSWSGNDRELMDETMPLITN